MLPFILLPATSPIDVLTNFLGEKFATFCERGKFVAVDPNVAGCVPRFLQVLPQLCAEEYPEHGLNRSVIVALKLGVSMLRAGDRSLH